MIDQAIIEFDKALRTVFASARSVRAMPGEDVPDAELGAAERSHAAALMRVNHVGEVCAQALYQGQSIMSREPAIRDTLRQAAQEETEHLAWTERRIAELGGRKSLLNPLWYGGALALGLAAGRFGERWNLGFLAETERLTLQVPQLLATGAAPKERAAVAQADVDLWDGINLLLLERILDLFDVGHTLENSVPRLIPMALRRFYQSGSPSKLKPQPPMPQPAGNGWFPTGNWTIPEHTLPAGPASAACRARARQDCRQRQHPPRHFLPSARPASSPCFSHWHL